MHSTSLRDLHISHHTLLGSLSHQKCKHRHRQQADGELEQKCHSESGLVCNPFSQSVVYQQKLIPQHSFYANFRQIKYNRGRCTATFSRGQSMWVLWALTLVSFTKPDDTGQDTGPRHQNVTSETLPNNVLLAIFASYLNHFNRIDVWCMLVHVCRKWRYLVFALPGHLDLQLECTIKTCAREMLGVWPAFPIVITDESDLMSGADNIIRDVDHMPYEPYVRYCNMGAIYRTGGCLEVWLP